MNGGDRPFEAARSSLIGDRDCNQDRSLVLSSGETVLLGLADGLGGHPRGEVAAQLFIDVCDSLFRRSPKPIPDPGHLMLRCIGKAHHAITRFGRRQSPPIEPRTTAVLAIVQSGVAYWAHVGDSRLYLLRDGRIHRKTQDHTQIRFVRQSAAEASRPRSSLTRCLGGVEEPPVTTCSLPTRLQPGDTIVLCSDGLWGQIPAAALTATLAAGEQPLAERLQSLIETAATQPHSDNVTAIAIRWLAETTAGTDDAVGGETSTDPRLDQAVRHLRRVLEKAGNTRS